MLSFPLLGQNPLKEQLKEGFTLAHRLKVQSIKMEKYVAGAGGLRRHRHPGEHDECSLSPPSVIQDPNLWNGTIHRGWVLPLQLT